MVAKGDLRLEKDHSFRSRLFSSGKQGAFSDRLSAWKDKSQIRLNERQTSRIDITSPLRSESLEQLNPCPEGPLTMMHRDA